MLRISSNLDNNHNKMTKLIPKEQIFENQSQIYEDNSNNVMDILPQCENKGNEQLLFSG